MNSREIVSVRAMQVFTSRSHPGIRVTVKTAGGATGTAMCTAGNSIGVHEVPFVYDGGSRWNGLGVQNAVNNVEKIIAPAIIGMDATQQYKVDHAMLSLSPDAKASIGGNAIAAVSAAVLKAGAAALDMPLYKHIGGENAIFLPVTGAPAVGGCNRYGGGVTTPDIKPTMSFMAVDFESFSEASYAAWEVQSIWQKKIEKIGAMANFHFYYHMPVGYFESDHQIWEIMTECIAQAGYEGRMGIQMDAASTCYYNEEKKLYQGLFSKEPRTKEELLEFYLENIKKYPIVVIEDPFNENDYESHAELTRRSKIQIVGDDLFTTMTSRVLEGAKIGAANTVLLKVNQVGTISEALEMIQTAYRLGYHVMPCESRGEGAEIADYTVGICATSVREGATGEAGNRFLEIERELGSSARFSGKYSLMYDRLKNR